MKRPSLFRAGDGAADRYAPLPLIRRLVAEQGMQHWKSYAFAFALMGIAAAATAGSAYVLGDVINAAYVDKNLTSIIALSSVVILLFVLKGVGTYGQAVILSRISNAIIAANQRALFDKLMTENMAFFSNRHSSEFVARLTGGAAAVTSILNMLVQALGRDLLSLIGLAAVMIIKDPVMSLIGLVIAPPAVFGIRKMVGRVRHIASNQYIGSMHVLETIQEALQGLRTVKAFTLEQSMKERMATNIAAVEHMSNKMARVANRASPLMETLGGIAVALALIYGGYRVVATNATPGEFFSFMTAFLLAYEPAKRLARLNIDLNSAIIGASMLLEVVDTPATEPDDSDKPALVVGPGAIAFEDVSFAYRDGETVIDHMSMTIRPGEVTALVGPSGGGKSTVLSLILRLHEIEDGRITIDGQDLAQVSRQSLRRSVSYVGQDVYLFRGSVRENIALGRPGASDDEIVAAAKAAFAHDFIMECPQGYDTPVGEHGAQLSGGQRQRIAIARALIKDAPIILLDEATAALDSESERAVQLAVDKLCQGRTTLVIAHRLHTIQHAQTIHVVEAGRIVESGTHDALMARNGRYATFFRIQHKEGGLLFDPSQALVEIANAG